MSGTAGISAAKQRRSRIETNMAMFRSNINNQNNNQNKSVANASIPKQHYIPTVIMPSIKPTIVVNKSSQLASKTVIASSSQPDNTLSPQLPVDPDTLRILGPMQPQYILKYHEHRLNRIDDKLLYFESMTDDSSTYLPTQSSSGLNTCVNMDVNPCDNTNETVKALTDKVKYLEDTLASTITKSNTFEEKIAAMQKQIGDINVSLNTLNISLTGVMTTNQMTQALSLQTSMIVAKMNVPETITVSTKPTSFVVVSETVALPDTLLPPSQFSSVEYANELLTDNVADSATDNLSVDMEIVEVNVPEVNVPEVNVPAVNVPAVNVLHTSDPSTEATTDNLIQQILASS